MRCRSWATLRLGNRPDSSVDDSPLAEQVIRIVEHQHRIRCFGRLEQRVEILLGVAHVLADDAVEIDLEQVDRQFVREHLRRQ